MPRQRSAQHLGLIVAALVLLAACVAPPQAEPVRHGYPANERPKYGNIDKNPAMLAADAQLIDAVTRALGSREAGASHAVQSGWRAYHQGNLAEAMKRFNQAWLLNPDNGDAYNGMATVVIDRDGDADGAIALFREGIQVDPQNAALHFDLAVTLFKDKHDYPGCIKEAQTALQLAPGNQMSLYQLGVCHAAAGQFDQAKAAMVKVEARYAKDPQFAYDYAQVFANTGEWPLALKWIEQAYQLAPSHPNVAYDRMRMSLNAGEKARACQALRDLDDVGEATIFPHHRAEWQHFAPKLRADCATAGH